MTLRLTTSTLALLVATAPAAFSLTADQVWGVWETYLTDCGYTVAVGNREGGGDSLTLKDVVLTITDENAGTTTAITLPTIAMSQTGGADVRTQYPDPATFTFSGRIEDGDDSADLQAEGTIDATRIETVSHEEGGHQVDTTKGSDTVFALTSLIVDGEGPEGTPITLTIRDLDSTTTMLGGLNITSEGRFGSMIATIDMTVPEESGNSTVKGQIEVGATDFSSESAFPDGHSSATAAALAEALRAGASMTGKGSVASFGMDLNVSSPADGDMMLAMKTGAISVDFGLAEAQLAYQGDITDVNYTLQGGTIPFPVQVGIGAISADLQFPLLAGEAPQPFKLSYSLGDLSLNDAIWGMIDRSGALPHDPANLDLDLTGELLIHEDLLTLAEQADAMGMDMVEPPLSPVSLKLNQLALSAVGVTANANGAVSFPDPSHLEVAVGTLNAEYKGVNGLMDKLVQAGLISNDDVQGVRMMMMMFAKPVEGQDDTLQTQLEMKEDGSIFANGMQLK